MSANTENREHDLDQYGGWRGKQFKATGFFYPVNDGDRWWFATPDGNAFLSFGINHYHAGWFSSSHNKEHWEKAFGGPAGSDAWREGLKRRVAGDFDRLGFNTLGIHNDWFLYGIKPYLAVYEPVRFSHYLSDLGPESYTDIFAPEFAAHCRALAKKVAGPLVNDPMLLGYQMSDCPVLTDKERQQLGKGYTWPLRLRNLGAEAAGKQAYVSLMKDRYQSIELFNETYGTVFDDWKELAAARNWRTEVSMVHQKELADNDAFNLVCIDKYYSVAKAELKKVDANHLFFGDKINANTEQLAKIVPVTRKHTDAVFYQMFGHWTHQEAAIKTAISLCDLPILNGDTSIAGPPSINQPNPCGPSAQSRKEQAELSRKNIEGAFAYPEIIGWHRCGIIDTWTSTPGKKEMQHQGVYDINGTDYLVGRSLKELSSRIYAMHMSGE